MKSKIRNISLLLLIIFIFSETKSQNSLKPAYEFKYHYGFILPHHKSFEYLIEDQVSAFEFNIAFPTKGRRKWQIAHKYPDLGFGVFYGNLQNPEILGNVLSVYPFINAPILKGRYFSLNYNLEFGLSYLTKKFNVDNNIYNIAIGSNFNGHVSFGLDLKFKIGERFDIKTGIGFTHFSNGAIRTPNKGINLVTINAALRYYNNRFKIPKEKPKIDFKSQNDFCIIPSIGIKQNDDPGGRNYLISSLLVEYIRQFHIKHGVGAGMDLFYDQSLQKLTVLDSVFSSTKKDYIYPGAHVAYNFIFGKTTFIVHVGVYFFNKPRTYQNIFSRIGMRFKITRHLVANISLKTYMAQADFAEFGLGYYW